ncbi:hypothetical protein [Campylobacter jejuni]|uniref:hypothetical protein n=1 Tax=Campylobacter jejuni TaxID=197 RepID=UPI00069B1BAD|nr:hypothetical protein [Campylobacter jejuni]
MHKINIKSFLNSEEFKHTVKSLKLVRDYIPKKYTYYSAKELCQELNKKNIKEICQYFRIKLIRNEKIKIPSKSYLKNDKIIIEFKDKKELYKQFGIIMKVFNNGIYFNHPNNDKKSDNIIFYEEKAEQFAAELKLLLDMGEVIKSSYQPMIDMGEVIKSSYQPMIDMGKKLINKEIPHPRTIKLDINKDMTQQYNHNNTNNLLMQEDMQYFYITPIKGEIYGKKTVFYNRNYSA